MRAGGAQVARFCVWFGAAAGVSVDISADQSTSWSTPTHVTRCPLHEPFVISDYQTFGVSLVPPGGGRFSVAQKEIPDAARAILNSSTGLILRYTSPPGASGLSLWRVRVNSATDYTVRFAHLFSIPADGVVNETRYMPWADFFGQITERNSTRILDCREISDPRCTIRPSSLTHVSFLESEDTIAHEILLHQVIVTTDPIEEQNAVQHHTEEAEALLWEREHAALGKEFDYNGTHYLIGGNCTAMMGICTMTTTPAPERVINVTVVELAVTAGAPVEAARYLSPVAITLLSYALGGH